MRFLGCDLSWAHFMRVLLNIRNCFQDPSSYQSDYQAHAGYRMRPSNNWAIHCAPNGVLSTTVACLPMCSRSMKFEPLAPLPGSMGRPLLTLGICHVAKKGGTWSATWHLLSHLERFCGGEGSARSWAWRGFLCQPLPPKLLFNLNPSFSTQFKHISYSQCK